MIPPVRRTVWLTEEQRRVLLEACANACSGNPPEHLELAFEQLRLERKRERITGRLVRGHVTGLRLPHDAIPVRFTDEEAHAMCDLPGLDDTLRRLLDPRM